MSRDQMDDEIHGVDRQFVEIERDPAEAASGEAGAQLMMQDGVAMGTVFGDGSQSAQHGGLLGELLDGDNR